MGLSITTTSGKILASVALVGTAAAVAGLGTYGAFTASTDASQQVESGKMSIELGTGNNTLVLPVVAGLLPGESTEQFATLSNNGDVNLGSVKLTTKDGSTSASALTTDTSLGLQVTIDSCTQAWTVVTTGADTCSGTKTQLLAASPIIVSGVALTSPSSLAAATQDHLKITTSLPSGANDAFQDLTSTISFAFDATQRASTVK